MYILENVQVYNSHKGKWILLLNENLNCLQTCDLKEKENYNETLYNYNNNLIKSTFHVYILCINHIIN